MSFFNKLELKSFFFQAKKDKLYFYKFFILSILISIFVLFLNIFIDILKLNNYYSSNHRSLARLMRYSSYLEAYRSLVDVSFSVAHYEIIENGKFFAAEIWDCNPCIKCKLPIWQTDSLFSGKKKRIEKSRYLFFSKHIALSTYNSSLYIGVEFPVLSYKSFSSEILKEKRYNLVFYKKLFDYNFFAKDNNFIISFGKFFVICVIFTFLFILYPFHLLKLSIERKIEKRIILEASEGARRLIAHELLNQENILNFSANVYNVSLFKRILHHNKVAQTALKNIHLESIDPLEVLKNVWRRIKMICYDSNVELFCNLNIRNKIKFDRSILFLAFNTILSNAVHSSVSCNKIRVKIEQKKSWFFSDFTVIEIENDGNKISTEMRQKIFSGVTSKTDGQGMGLKALKDILEKSGSYLKLHNKKMTCFSFKMPISEEKMCVRKKIIIKNKIKVRKKYKNNL